MYYTFIGETLYDLRIGRRREGVHSCFWPVGLQISKCRKLVRTEITMLTVYMFHRFYEEYPCKKRKTQWILKLCHTGNLKCMNFVNAAITYFMYENFTAVEKNNFCYVSLFIWSILKRWKLWLRIESNFLFENVNVQQIETLTTEVLLNLKNRINNAVSSHF